MIASGHKRLWGEGFVARILGDAGDASPVPDALVVLDHVVARIGQLDLPGQERDGDLGAMRLNVTALIGLGRVRGGAHGSRHPELHSNMGGLLLQVAEDAVFVVWILVVAVVADLGVEIGGDLGAAAPPLSLRALAEMGLLEAQGRQLVCGQGEPLGELLVPGRLGAVSGHRLDR